MECACGPGVSGVQRCVGGAFEVCQCALTDSGVTDGGVTDAEVDGGLTDGSMDGAVLLEEGAPCIAPDVLDDSPPTPDDPPPTSGRCTEDGALFCDPQTSTMRLDPCRVGVCVEDEVTVVACPECTPMRPELRYRWAACVLDAEPACELESAHGRWDPVNDEGPRCEGETLASYCGPLSGNAVPNFAGSPRGYRRPIPCEEGAMCTEGLCLFPWSCTGIDESYCDDSYIYTCRDGLGAERQEIPAGTVCRDNTACTEVGVDTVGTFPDTGAPRCTRGAPPRCDPTNTGLLHCRDNCYGESVCMCDTSFEACPDDFRCLESDASARCVPDFECPSAPRCEGGAALSCSGDVPQRVMCSDHGNDCAVQDGRAICRADGACEAEPICAGNTIELCCDFTGEYFSDTGVTLPCVPGELIRFRCPPGTTCGGGRCMGPTG